VRIFLTGGAGFIGSHLAERLLDEGHEVTAHDNLSLGRREFLAACEGRPGFRFLEGDLLDREALAGLLAGHDAVFHMAANSDIAAGGAVTDTDLRQGTLATFHVLDGMRRQGIRQLVFASTSAVYGEARKIPTPEDYGPLFPISLYGASKLACEGLISAFEHAYGVQAWIFRFANIVGDHGTHGAVVDFIRKLRENPRELEILGDGRQAKPYLYVKECVDGMLYGWTRGRERVNCFNLACQGATSVLRIAEIVRGEMGLPEAGFRFTGGDRGWVGDVPQVRLDPSRLAEAGWKARLDSDGAVREAVRALLSEGAAVGGTGPA
jgi:UDP-glucose 4-epimerase